MALRHARNALIARERRGGAEKRACGGPGWDERGRGCAGWRWRVDREGTLRRSVRTSCTNAHGGWRASFTSRRKSWIGDGSCGEYEACARSGGTRPGGLTGEVPRVQL